MYKAVKLGKNAVAVRQRDDTMPDANGNRAARRAAGAWRAQCAADSACNRRAAKYFTICAYHAREVANAPKR